MSETDTISALAASLNAGLDEDEAAAKAVEDNSAPWDGQWQAHDGYLETRSGIALAVGTGRYFGRDMVAAGVIEHAARHDPARGQREVAAMRDLIATMVAEPHLYLEGDSWYSCSQAVIPDPDDDEDRMPGSGCMDDTRRGKPCDCGRDRRVEKMLTILAGIYAGPGGTDDRDH